MKREYTVVFYSQTSAILKQFYIFAESLSDAEKQASNIFAECRKANGIYNWSIELFNTIYDKREIIG